MKIYQIINEDEKKVLREKTKLVDLERENKKELRGLVRKMRSTMKSVDGIGLSANQIGISKRLFVAQVPRFRDGASDEKFYAVFNPRITKKSKETISLDEGCLSIPGEFGSVPRHERITLEGQTIEGKKIKIKAWGLLARVFQHEIDHLDGKLFIDRVKK